MATIEKHVAEAERNLDVEPKTGEDTEEIVSLLRSIAHSLLALAYRSMEQRGI